MGWGGVTNEKGIYKISKWKLWLDPKQLQYINLSRIYWEVRVISCINGILLWNFNCIKLQREIASIEGYIKIEKNLFSGWGNRMAILLYSSTYLFVTNVMQQSKQSSVSGMGNLFQSWHWKLLHLGHHT